MSGSLRGAAAPSRTGQTAQGERRAPARPKRVSRLLPSMEEPDCPSHHQALPRTAVFRFYEELNDFLPQGHRKRDLVYTFTGTRSVKDAVEAIGVPHPEIDLVLVDGESVGFDHRLEGGERVAVYPVFERLDISPVVRLRPRPLRDPRFLLDVHLRRLARYLRMAGFDAEWDPSLDDAQLVARSVAVNRILLTRDRTLMRHGALVRGRWIRNSDPVEQLAEVVRAFQLEERLAPFSRCMVCNALLEAAGPEHASAVPESVRSGGQPLRRCTGCGRVYWHGSHVRRMTHLLERLASNRVRTPATAPGQEEPPA